MHWARVFRTWILHSELDCGLNCKRGLCKYKRAACLPKLAVPSEEKYKEKLEKLSPPFHFNVTCMHTVSLASLGLCTLKAEKREGLVSNDYIGVHGNIDTVG